MKAEFNLYISRDRYYIRHACSLNWTIPLLLGHGETNFMWTTELADAKPFQYRVDAMKFVETNFPSWSYIIEGINCRVSMSLTDKLLIINPTRSGLLKVELNQLTDLASIIRH